jgi:hypothetical protein
VKVSWWLSPAPVHVTFTSNEVGGFRFFLNGPKPNVATLIGSADTFAKT